MTGQHQLVTFPASCCVSPEQKKPTRLGIFHSDKWKKGKACRVQLHYRARSAWTQCKYDPCRSHALWPDQSCCWSYEPLHHWAANNPVKYVGQHILTRSFLASDLHHHCAIDWANGEREEKWRIVGFLYGFDYRESGAIPLGTECTAVAHGSRTILSRPEQTHIW